MYGAERGAAEAGRRVGGSACRRVGVSAYRRIGVSACRRLQSVLQLRRDLLITKTMSKSSLASPDADPPIRFR